MLKCEYAYCMLDCGTAILAVFSRAGSPCHSIKYRGSRAASYENMAIITGIGGIVG
jgi:hypothetical protein